jgi:hypothetical protein
MGGIRETTLENYMTTPQYDDAYLDEMTTEEREAYESTKVDLDPHSQAFVDALVERLLKFADELSGHPLHGYQRPFAARIMESMIIKDGATVTALFSRQSGKTETVAATVATLMIMLPRLAKIEPFDKWLHNYKEGVWVGAFAPVDDMAKTLFSRIVTMLNSERAQAILLDPAIDDRVSGRGAEMKLERCGSLVRRQTAHPRANIEGKTYHICLLDESQVADQRVVDKSIRPMKASTNGTFVMTGTPTYEKGVFYREIQTNKRKALVRGARTNHFEADYREVSKWNDYYKDSVAEDMLRMGYESDEFKLSYRLMWLLEQGMFTTSERLVELGDKSMPVQKAYYKTPIVIGIDPGRKIDSTIVTAVMVDWTRPDEFGYYNCRILNWLDLQGQGWESQYHRIVEFVSKYNVWAIGVDAGGMGDIFISRLRVLLPHISIIDVSSQRPAQSERWKYLREMLDHGRIAWPAHAKTVHLRTYKNFIQQMSDLQVKFEGPYMLAEAPKEVNAHDDYCDSLAIALSIIPESTIESVEVSNNPFYDRRRS